MLDTESELAECYDRLGPLVRRQVRRLVPAAQVDDVVQVVFLEVWRSRDRYDPARSLEAWVLAIARRRAIDQIRAESRHSSRGVPLQDADGARDDTADLDRAQDVRRALAKLPAPQREALELAHFQRFTQREIADLLAIPLGTVKARTARGLHRLGELL